jgi:hypothetical protein
MAVLVGTDVRSPELISINSAKLRPMILDGAPSVRT